MTKHYLALTIGPIYETMKYCQKTRELWVGSYFFSYFMRTLIGRLDDDIKLIIPYVPENKDEKKSMLEQYKEEGIFHDRFIATSSKSKETLKELLDDKIDETLEQVIGDLDIENGHYEALKDYLQYHYIIAKGDELLSATDKPNVIFAIDTILDSMELENSFDFDNSTKVCELPQEDYSLQKDGLVTPLAKLQYEATDIKRIISNTNLSFKSIPKIAIANIWTIVKNDESKDKILKEVLDKLEKDVYIEKKNEENIYDKFYNLLSKQYSNDFKPHHKYYAVIYADGDKMGSTIRSIYEGDEKDEKIKELSKNIYEYISHDSEDEGETSLYKVIDAFGGMLIFAGGDDILAFAPIVGTDERTVFDLLEELSIRFIKHMGSDVSLSFGLNINYYKSPMITAIDGAYNLLLSAKNHNTKKQSGSVSLSLTKHSGQSFETTFFIEKDKDSIYQNYKTLFSNELKQKSALPHNIQYSLQNSEYLICDIFKNNPIEVAYKRLKALFTNSIKDESHSDKSKKALTELQEYIKVLQPKNKDDFTKLITQLAIIKFLRGDK